MKQSAPKFKCLWNVNSCRIYMGLDETTAFTQKQPVDVISGGPTICRSLREPLVELHQAVKRGDTSILASKREVLMRHLR